MNLEQFKEIIKLFETPPNELKNKYFLRILINNNYEYLSNDFNEIIIDQIYLRFSMKVKFDLNMSSVEIKSCSLYTTENKLVRYFNWLENNRFYLQENNKFAITISFNIGG